MSTILEQISDTDGNVILAWAKSSKIMLYADSAIKLHEFCQRHGFPVNDESLTAAFKSSELQGQLQFDSWDPAFESIQALVKEFLKYAPKGLLNEASTGVTPEVAGRLTKIIREQYGRYFSISNLLGAAKILQEQMFGPADPAPKSPEQVRAEAIARREQRETDERFRQLQLNRRGQHTSTLESELSVANQLNQERGKEIKPDPAPQTARSFKRLPDNPTREQMQAASSAELKEFLSRARKGVRTL
jgi:hypothetical protein